MRNEIINSIIDNKLIAIIRGVEKEKLSPLVLALYNGGIRLVEVTYSQNGRVSDEETAQNIAMLSGEFSQKMYVGAGTVTTPEQVELTARAGGTFIISPDTNPDVIKKTREMSLVSIPGALTPSEANAAKRAGADFVKLFPVVNLGADYVKAIKAPLSDIKFLAVGGIDENNIGEYKKSGVCGFGIGTNIINKELLKNNDFDGITELAKKYVWAVEK